MCGLFFDPVYKNPYPLTFQYFACQYHINATIGKLTCYDCTPNRTLSLFDNQNCIFVDVICLKEG